MVEIKDMAKEAESISEKCRKRERTPMVWPPKDANTLKIFKASGFNCAIVKNMSMGNINGYVLLPKSHPDSGKHYDDIDVRVHGGLTFTQKDSKGGYWYGFDTAHAGDFVPLMPYHFEANERHWTEGDVMVETKDLAKQFKARIKLR